MQLDVRTPIGYLFTIFGVVLTVFGFVSDKAIYAKHSLGININLAWGVVLLAFGILMLLLAARGKKKSSGE